MNCPVCEQAVDAEAPDCPHCQTILRREGNPYAAQLEVLNTAVGRLIRGEGGVMTAERATGLFAHVTGAVQQMLDTARDDLDRNFRRLSSAVKGEDPDVMRFVEAFNTAQREINEALVDFGQLLASSRDPVEIDRNRGAFDQVRTRIQAAVATLVQADAESEDPLLAEPAVEPLPPQVPQSLDAIAEAMGALDRYIADRDLAGIEDCLGHLDAARGPLAALLTELRAQRAETAESADDEESDGAAS